MGFGRSNKRSAPAPPPAAPARTFGTAPGARPPAPAPQAAAPPPMMQQPSQGPGMMGIMGSSMAGSLAGQAVGSYMFGGGSSQQAAPPAQAAPQGQMMPQAPMCSLESQQFLQCMSSTGDNMDQCRQFYDMYKLCSSQVPQQGYYQQ